MHICISNLGNWHQAIIWTNAVLLTHWGRHNGRHFPDDIFKCIFLNENVWILLKISLKFVPKVRITDILALVQIMAWRRPGDKPLSEPMMVVSSQTHICVTGPQWFNLTPGNQFQWNWNQNTAIFIQENLIENIVSKCQPFYHGLNMLCLDTYDVLWCKTTVDMDFKMSVLYHESVA